MFAHIFIVFFTFAFCGAMSSAAMHVAENGVGCSIRFAGGGRRGGWVREGGGITYGG